VAANGDTLVSFGPHRGRGRGGRRAGARVDRQPGVASSCNPHPVCSGDLDHRPNELRVDLDPGPGVGWADVRSVAGGR